jgi:toxin YoeB
MSYTIVITLDAEKDIEKFKKSGDKKVLLKIDKLLDELRVQPKRGIGTKNEIKLLNYILHFPIIFLNCI